MLFNPQQELALKYLLDPKSETFGNFSGSLVKAGFAQTYADNITIDQPKWLIEGLGKARTGKMLVKAEKVLEKTLDMNTENHIKVGEGIVIKQDPALVKIQQDTAKFIAGTIGKDLYSTRQEVTGKDGKDLFIKEEEKDMIDKAINNI